MKKIQTRALALTAALFFAAAGLSGCKQEGAAPPASTGESAKQGTAAGETQTIKYSMWDVSLRQQEIDEVIKPFEAAHPDIKVDFQPMPWDDYWKKLQVMMASGTAPDVFAMSLAYYSEYAGKNTLLNLSDRIARDLNMDDYYEATFEQVRYPASTGDMYALPYGWVCSVLYYNKDMFDAEGLAYPSESWTWDDLFDAAQKLTKGEGLEKEYGFLISGNHEFLDEYTASYGGRFVSADFSSCTVNENAVVAERLQYLCDMIEKQGISPSPAQTKGQPDPFLSGKVAMAVSGSYNIATYRDIKDFDWDIALIPQCAETGKRIVYGGPDILSISAQTAAPEAAWEFAKFYIGENRKPDSFMGGKVPTYMPNAENDVWREADKKPEHKTVVLDSAPYLESYFAYKWSEWRSSVVQNELDSIFNGSKSIQEGLSVIETKTSAILNEGGA